MFTKVIKVEILSELYKKPNSQFKAKYICELVFITQNFDKKAKVFSQIRELRSNKRADLMILALLTRFHSLYNQQEISDTGTLCFMPHER